MKTYNKVNNKWECHNRVKWDLSLTIAQQPARDVHLEFN
jgi:hypothetical protein